MMIKSCKCMNGGSLRKGDLLVVNRRMIGRLKNLTVVLESCTNQLAKYCLNLDEDDDNEFPMCDHQCGPADYDDSGCDQQQPPHHCCCQRSKKQRSKNGFFSEGGEDAAAVSCSDRLKNASVIMNECSKCLEKMIGFILKGMKDGGGGGGGSGGGEGSGSGSESAGNGGCHDEGIHSDFNESDSCECFSRTSPTLSSDSSCSKFPPTCQSYEYYIPISMPNTFELCGRLIGKRGIHVEHIREVAKTEVLVRTDCNSECNQIVTLKGKRKNVLSALSMISERFPVDKHPDISLEPIYTCVIKPRKNPFGLLKRSLSAPLPTNTVSTVAVCCVMSPTHFFVHQPCKIEYSYLDSLVFAMTSLYENCEMTPQLVRPIHIGAICSVAYDMKWYRGVVCEVNTEKELANVCYGDFGGYQWFPFSSLRMLRCDFGSLPFQATEVLLQGMRPSPDSERHIESIKSYFGSQYFQAEVVGVSSNGAQTVDMFYYNSKSERIYVRNDLIKMGYATNV